MGSELWMIEYESIPDRIFEGELETADEVRAELRKLGFDPLEIEDQLDELRQDFTIPVMTPLTPEKREEHWSKGPLLVSGVRRKMDGQNWLRIVDEHGTDRAYVPFGDRTQAEYAQCMSDAKRFAAAPKLYEALTAAESALRSYQYGNSAPDLAEEVADTCSAALTQAGGSDE